jgi:chromosome transmission fidelity protein 18
MSEAFISTGLLGLGPSTLSLDPQSSVSLSSGFVSNGLLGDSVTSVHDEDATLVSDDLAELTRGCNPDALSREDCDQSTFHSSDVGPRNRENCRSRGNFAHIPTDLHYQYNTLLHSSRQGYFQNRTVGLSLSDKPSSSLPIDDVFPLISDILGLKPNQSKHTATNSTLPSTLSHTRAPVRATTIDGKTVYIKRKPHVMELRKVCET